MTFSTSRSSAGRLAAAGAAVSLAALLAGCGVHQPDDTASLPPPPAEAYPAAPPADLAGAPPSPAAPTRPMDGLAGGPPGAYAPPPVISMAPIANPEDMAVDERHRVYGGKYDRHGRGDRHAESRHAPDRHDQGRHAQGRHGAHRGRAAAGPHAAGPHAAPPHAAKPAAPKTVAPPPKAPAPAHPAAPALKPAVPAPALKTPAPAAAPLDPKTAQLQTALSVPVVAGSALTAAPDIAKGAPGQVALSLPQTLLDLIRQQAGKVGLARAARSAQVTATLTGTGYEIAPGGAQTARLEPGVAPHFLWNVTPLPGVAHSPLHADVQAALTGERKPRTFPLAAFEQPGAPAADSSDKLGLGGLSGQPNTLIGIGMLVAAIILMLVFANRAMASREKARKRRAQEARDTEAREAEMREFQAREAELRARNAAPPPAVADPPVEKHDPD